MKVNDAEKNIGETGDMHARTLLHILALHPPPKNLPAHLLTRFSTHFLQALLHATCGEVVLQSGQVHF